MIYHRHYAGTQEKRINYKRKTFQILNLKILENKVSPSLQRVFPPLKRITEARTEELGDSRALLFKTHLKN